MIDGTVLGLKSSSSIFSKTTKNNTIIRSISSCFDEFRLENFDEFILTYIFSNYEENIFITEFLNYVIKKSNSNLQIRNVCNNVIVCKISNNVDNVGLLYLLRIIGREFQIEDFPEKKFNYEYLEYLTIKNSISLFGDTRVSYSSLNNTIITLIEFFDDLNNLGKRKLKDYLISKTYKRKQIKLNNLPFNEFTFKEFKKIKYEI